MLIELKQTGSDAARACFAHPHARLVVDAVAEGTRFGKLWVDQGERPGAALMWTGSHRCYLGGDIKEPFLTAVREFLADTLVPEIRRRGNEFLQIALPPQACEQDALSITGSWSLAKRARVLFARRRGDCAQSAQDPSSFCIRRIDKDLLSDADVLNVGSVLEEIGGEWQSTEEFLRKGGGFCVLHDSTIVCWCTMEYVSSGKCGLGIETVESYRRQGLATLAASAVINHVTSLGLTLFWDSWQDNVPSIALAERLGFDRAEDYFVYFGLNAGVEPTRGTANTSGPSTTRTNASASSRKPRAARN